MDQIDSLIFENLSRDLFSVKTYIELKKITINIERNTYEKKTQSK